MLSVPIKPLLLIIACSCHNGDTKSSNRSIDLTPKQQTTNAYKQVSDIPLPVGYTRQKSDSNSFAAYLRTIKLSKDNTVYLYDGSKKKNQLAQFAVLDISVGNKNLQQCADAVMRLRAEYLYKQKQFDKIFFRDNEGIAYLFRIPYTRGHFNMYLQQVFGMCGTASLAKQLYHKVVKDIAPGDVFIRGGFPGHAVLVTDIAINKQGNKIYLLCQSYMPAQSIHILVNPVNKQLSPWYAVDTNSRIATPEYLFKSSELMSWQKE